MKEKRFIFNIMERVVRAADVEIEAKDLKSAKEALWNFLDDEPHLVDWFDVDGDPPEICYVEEYDHE